MTKKKVITLEERNALIDSMSDDDLYKVAASITPWSSPVRSNDSAIKNNPADSDGFITGMAGDYAFFRELQNECWNKFISNPHISSHVRDFAGDLAGSGFGWGSEEPKIEEVLREISDDVRNELLLKMHKFAARAEIEGELFQSLSLHPDGFVEVDFMEPSDCQGGENCSGIYFHPRKRTLPIFYEFTSSTTSGSSQTAVNTKKNAGGKVPSSTRSSAGMNKLSTGIDASILIPSIYVAYYPILAEETINHFKLDRGKMKTVMTSSRKYNSLGGFNRFIVSWDRGFLTQRNVSHIKTTLEWINHYENLKKWEIDHKKSAGAYLWVVTMEDAKAFRAWLKMTDEERAATGLTAQKTPGGTLICPPGITIECKNPNLPSISEQDNDIMHMITSGLNRPEDTVTGQTKGDTFSGVNASRGPMADRIGDEIQYFENYLRYTFWRGIFYLRSQVTNFKMEYKMEEVVDFKDKKPITKKVIKQAHELIDFDFPTPEITNVSDKAGAYMGSKHLNVVESLGIPRKEVAKKIGFGNYDKKRKLYEMEKNKYPDLPSQVAIESMQEAGGEGRMVNPGTDPNASPDSPGTEKPGAVPQKKAPLKANPKLKRKPVKKEVEEE